MHCMSLRHGEHDQRMQSDSPADVQSDAAAHSMHVPVAVSQTGRDAGQAVAGQPLASVPPESAIAASAPASARNRT